LSRVGILFSTGREASRSKSEAVAAATLALEVPLVNRARPEDDVVLAEKERESVRHVPTSILLRADEVIE
jgi:hypothetical protein